ncbi:hypothetical protein T439DRAFT_351111 [Meredithblackwellia eburnea MCA 4105]
MSLLGSCNCESIQVSVAATDFPASSVLCHCTNCRKAGGSTYSTNLVVPTAKIRVEKGSLKQTKTKGDSGAWALRNFCGDCGSPVYTIIEGKEDTAYLKGAIWTRKIPPPFAEIYTKNKEGWEPELQGVAMVESQ